MANIKVSISCVDGSLVEMNTESADTALNFAHVNDHEGGIMSVTIFDDKYVYPLLRQLKHEQALQTKE